MSLTAAYSKMRKSGHKMASGGMCEKCSGPCMYDDGGQVKDSNPSMSDKNPSMASSPTPKIDPDKAKAFMSGFSKPHLADGGEVKGVHNPSYSRETDQGQSEAGDATRQAHSKGQGSVFRKGLMDRVKAEHHKVLGEMKSMPNPKLKGLSEGGKVYSVGPMKDMRQPSMKSQEAYSEGGPVENESDMDKDMSPDMDSDSEMHEGVAKEMMDSMKKGDHKGMLESLKALIMSMKD